MTLKNKQKIIVFDVDGVILDSQKGAFKEILLLLGKEKEVALIHEEYLRRRHLGPWGLEEMTTLYSGFSESELRNLAFEYCQDHLMPGVEATIMSLKQKKHKLLAISSNPQFVMDALSDMFPFSFAEGNIFEFKNSICTGKLLRKVDRFVKKEILQNFIKKENWEKSQIVVVGDSITDLPLSTLGSTLIAVCPKDPDFKKAADHVVLNKDLTEILQYIN